MSYEGIKLAKNFLDFKITVGFCTYVKILGLLKEVNLTLYQFDIICKLSKATLKRTSAQVRIYNLIATTLYSCTERLILTAPHKNV